MIALISRQCRIARAKLGWWLGFWFDFWRKTTSICQSSWLSGRFLILMLLFSPLTVKKTKVFLVWFQFLCELNNQTNKQTLPILFLIIFSVDMGVGGNIKTDEHFMAFCMGIWGDWMNIYASHPCATLEMNLYSLPRHLAPMSNPYS